MPTVSIGYYKELQKVAEKKPGKAPLKEWIWNKGKRRLRRIPDKGSPLFVLYGAGDVEKTGQVLQVKCNCGATDDDAFQLCSELVEGIIAGAIKFEDRYKVRDQVIKDKGWAHHKVKQAACCCR